MKKYTKAGFITICICFFLALMMWSPEVASAAPEEINAKTFYYDKMPADIQSYYTFLKEYADNMPNKIGEYRIDVSKFLPKNATAEDCNTLGRKFLIANLAMLADDPLYEWKARVTGYYQDVDSSGKMKAVVIVERTELLTDEHQKQAEARIKQIVDTVGKGDRYTVLRKLTHYLMTNTFYDPCLFELNADGTNKLDTRGQAYNASAYGLLLENIAICDGFADTVKVLCNELNIPCILMGNAGHAWNIVQMEDGKWYLLDITNVAGLGPDAGPVVTPEEYFKNQFLNYNFGMYGDPYMIALDGVAYVTDFPETSSTMYQYTGSTTDFSYTVAKSTYTPGTGKFIYKINRDNKTCTIINYEGKETGNLTIPSKIDGYIVTAIADYAFYYCSDFTGKLTIPDTVLSIGQGAFAGCTGLTSIEFLNNLHQIKKGAFAVCSGLTSVSLPDSVGEVGEYAFYKCKQLKTVSFGTHIQIVGTQAFNYTANGLVMKGPANSAASKYASNHGITYQTAGTLCALNDTDGKWEFDNDSHFHTCEHGARFEFGSHTNANGYFQCGSTCSICKAEYCANQGFMENVTVLRDKRPATCYEPEYSGDLTCVCGQPFQYGEYIGEAKGHKFTTESESATCSVCGAKKGESNLFDPDAGEDTETEDDSETNNQPEVEEGTEDNRQPEIDSNSKENTTEGNEDTNSNEKTENGSIGWIIGGIVVGLVVITAVVLVWKKYKKAR